MLLIQMLAIRLRHLQHGLARARLLYLGSRPAVGQDLDARARAGKG